MEQFLPQNPTTKELFKDYMKFSMEEVAKNDSLFLPRLMSADDQNGQKKRMWQEQDGKVVPAEEELKNPGTRTSGLASDASDR